MSKVIVVTGSTGQQGGSVARTMLKTGDWRVRGITRNSNNEAATKLKHLGAEVVQADYDNEQSLVDAFKDATAIFAMTNFFELLFRVGKADQAGELEEGQGMNLARAASKTSTLQHYVWHTLQPAAKMTGGKYPVPECDYKARVEERIRSELPDLAIITSFLMMSYYPSNMAGFPLCKPFELPMSGGKYVWLQPCRPTLVVPIAGDVEVNVGIFVRQLLANPRLSHGKYAHVCTENLPYSDLLKIWAEVVGKEATYIEVSSATFEELWPMGGKDIAQQFEFGQAIGDWEAHCKKDLLTPAQLGIKEGELVGVKQAFEKMKDKLL